MAAPALPALYSFTQINPAVGACDAISSVGSKIKVARMVDPCDLQPPELRITTGAVASQATSASLTLAQIGGVTATGTDRRVISKGTRLWFGAAGAATNSIVVNQEATLIGASPVVVSIDPAPAALLVSDICLTWGLLALPTYQNNLPLSKQDATEDSTEGESFYTATAAVSSTLTMPLMYKITDDLTAHQAVVYPGILRPDRNIFVAVLRNGFPVVCGPAKVLNGSRGQNKLAMIDASLQFQSTVYFPGYPSQMASGSAELANYNRVIQMAGF